MGKTNRKKTGGAPQKKNLDTKFKEGLEKTQRKEYNQKKAEREKKKADFLSRKWGFLFSVLVFDLFRFVLSKKEKGFGISFVTFTMNEIFIKIPRGGYQLAKYSLFNFHISREQVGVELLFISIGFSFTHGKFAVARMYTGKL